MSILIIGSLFIDDLEEIIVNFYVPFLIGAIVLIHLESKLKINHKENPSQGDLNNKRSPIGTVQGTGLFLSGAGPIGMIISKSLSDFILAALITLLCLVVFYFVYNYKYKFEKAKLKKIEKAEQKIGKLHWLLDEEITLAAKLTYSHGIELFDELMIKNQEYYDAVIHFVKHPNGLKIRLAQLFKTASIGLKWEEIDKISISNPKSPKLIIYSKDLSQISFSFKYKDFFEIQEYLNKIKVNYDITSEFETYIPPAHILDFKSILFGIIYISIGISLTSLLTNEFYSIFFYGAIVLGLTFIFSSFKEKKIEAEKKTNY
ncbi:hypothetical protein [Mangrovimonas xylaniphaga]|uniref:hypothetical protein n=1 Tax=Mangrovimonas xylaniphaga TaxID=1645915 RepID=UPI0006B681BF|nr:hypothetical protein [Mangrovimonas xylaniphaga]